MTSATGYKRPNFQEGIRQVLHAHDVLEPVVSTLEWSNKRYTGLLFFTGIAIYVLNEVVGIGLMMLLGVVAILQLLVYRFLLKLQSHELISKQVLGDFLRLTEERVKDIALSRDYVELFEAMLFLFFLSGVGRLVSFPTLVISFWAISFTALPIYHTNESLFDSLTASVHNVLKSLAMKTSKAQ